MLNHDQLQTFIPPDVNRIRNDIRFGHTTLFDLEQEGLDMLNSLGVYANPEVVIAWVESIFNLSGSASEDDLIS